MRSRRVELDSRMLRRREVRLMVMMMVVRRGTMVSLLRRKMMASLTIFQMPMTRRGRRWSR